MNNFYPIQVNLKNKSVVIIGGGKISYRKLITLLKAEANITIISPSLNENIKDLMAAQKSSKINWECRDYKNGDLKGAFLAFALTNSDKVNREVKKEASLANIPVNLASHSHEGDFISSNTLKLDELTLAISTNGKAPIVAKEIKEYLHSDLYLRKIASYISLLSEKKKDLLKNPLFDQPQREKELRKYFKNLKENLEKH